MLAIRKRKLILIGAVIIAIFAASFLLLYALRANISLFYTPSQVLQEEAPLHRSIRIGGMVEKGSLHRLGSGLEVEFTITDLVSRVKIRYQGVLPDLFREGQGVVAEGELLPHHVFQARQVLAKHDENYMPPEVKAALTEAQK